MSAPETVFTRNQDAGAARIVERVVEAAPARGRIGLAAGAALVGFGLLAARAGELAVSGALAAPPASVSGPAASAPLTAAPRADLVDRNGVLLASTVRGWTLVGRPADVWDADAAAAQLVRLFPDLDLRETRRRLTEAKQVVHLRRGLSDADRRAVLDEGIAGIGFEPAQRRVYPQGRLAGHALGAVNTDGAGAAGLELGLQERLAVAGAAGRPVRLSLDVRLQHLVEEELAASVAEARAAGGAAVLLDGRTGEVLAIASNPAVAAGRVRRDGPVDGAAQALFEMGSTVKPLTIALGLEAGVITPQSRFDTEAVLTFGTRELREPHPRGRDVGLREALAHSSNIAAMQTALALGEARQAAGLRAFGLYDRALPELPASERPLTPRAQSQMDVAVRGFGHGMSVSLVSLAGAYTVFVNDGARVAPTLLWRDPAADIPRTQVVSATTARTVLGLMRAVVTEGTGRRADVAGLEIAGKTGTAEKPGRATYSEDRNLASFVAVFPAAHPRYVLALALDEPGTSGAGVAATAAGGPAGAAMTGGATAAPAVGRLARRIAPMLGLRVEPASGGGPSAAPGAGQ